MQSVIGYDDFPKPTLVMQILNVYLPSIQMRIRRVKSFAVMKTVLNELYQYYIAYIFIKL